MEMEWSNFKKNTIFAISWSILYSITMAIVILILDPWFLSIGFHTTLLGTPITSAIGYGIVGLIDALSLRTIATGLNINYNEIQEDK